MNESRDPEFLVRKYERQIAGLKQELAMRDALSGRGRVTYDEFTDMEKQEVKRVAKLFLKGSLAADDLRIDSLNHVREIFRQMREVRRRRRRREWSTTTHMRHKHASPHPTRTRTHAPVRREPCDKLQTFCARWSGRRLSKSDSPFPASFPSIDSI